MGKLTYRKISGAKLGQSIQRDIQKKIPKPGEEKKLAAVQRDPVVELDASGRQLGQEGVFLVCDALYELGRTKLTRVEELNLSGNDLTVACLKDLRRALLACPDLRDLDISNNSIAVTTAAEMEEWARFLESFSNLKHLRRLDISHNPVGDIAIEIMFRTYALEKEIFIPVDYKTAGLSEIVDEPTDVDYSVDGFDIRSSGGHLYLASHYPPVCEADLDRVGPDRKMSTGTTSTSGGTLLSSSPPSSFESIRDHADIHGLRGIPYIVLSDIGVTDLAALWLSHIIPEHPLPSDFQTCLPPLKEGNLASILRKYDSLETCRGIIFMENAAVTNLGLRVLKEAEERRDEDAATVEELITNGQARRRSSGVTDVRPDENARYEPNRRNSIAQDDSFSLKARKALNESRYNIDKTRAKIQLKVLKEKGISASLLWSRVMRIIIVSRAILLDYNGPIQIEGHEPTIKIEAREIEARGSVRNSIDNSFSAANDLSLDKLSLEGVETTATPGLESNPSHKDYTLPGKLPIEIWMKIILLAEDSSDLTTVTQRLNIFHWACSRASIANELEYLSESMESQARRVLAKVKGLTYEL